MYRHLKPATLVTPLAALLWIGCGTLPGGEEPSGAIAARIGDGILTVDELDDQIKEDLFARETGNRNAARLYDVRSKALKSVLANRVLDAEASSRGLTRDELIAEQFPLPEVSDDEVQRFYAVNTGRLRGAPLEQVAGDIRRYLQEEARQKSIAAFVAERSNIVLERQRISLRPGGPSKGPDDARVTIVEFSDFQCPYCQRAIPVLEEVAKRHPEDVRVVYRHLPLDSIHPQARPSAEASACAHDGGKFWEYHDLLFANNRALGPADLRGYAEQVGLELESFDDCVATRRHAAAVQADALEAQSIGITGTPAFVVNGIVLFGLQSTDALDEIVRGELAGDGSDS
jgi:protein-disulfide isomerase